MWRLALLAAMLFWATSGQSAEIPFLNPFAAPPELSLQRGAPQNATQRVTFRRTTKINAEAEQIATIVIDVADDWALYNDGSQTVLYDYRLMSLFVIDISRGSFTVGSKVAQAAFLAAEIGNRKVLANLVESAGAGDDTMGGACDAETALSSRLREGDAFRGNVSIDREESSITAACNGRTVGIIQRSDGGAVPAALWPTLVTTFPLHPALAAELADMQSVPRQIQVFYEQLGRAVTVTLTLETSAPSATPYPLTAELKNASAAQLAATTSPELASLAEAAIAGTADGGVPTSAIWEQRLNAMGQDGSPSRAILALLPTSAMFPELLQGCSPDSKTAACVLAANAMTFAEVDPAVKGALTIAVAEQSGNPGLAMAAMKAAQDSTIADDPVLGQAFALALLRFGGAFQGESAAAGLPADPLPLMLRTLEAYPYNPWYWTDLADLYIARWDYGTAMTLLAVAFSLDIPAAANPALLAKGPTVEAVRESHPAFFLPD